MHKLITDIKCSTLSRASYLSVAVATTVNFEQAAELIGDN